MWLWVLVCLCVCLFSNELGKQLFDLFENFIILHLMEFDVCVYVCES